MKRLALLFLLSGSLNFLQAQDFLPTGTTEEILKQQPGDFIVLDTTFGDLNRDTFPDLVMVWRQAKEPNLSELSDDPVLRPLLLYTGQPDGTLKLAARNDRVVLCYACGGMMGDPYMQTVIKNGYFTIEHYGGSGWRWTRLITFRYSVKDTTWYLHKDGGDSFHTGDPDNVGTTVRTTRDFGTISFETFDSFSEN